MSEYFPKWKSYGANVKVELDLSNYGTKADLKNATGVDTLDFAKKTDLGNLKSDVDKSDIDKLKNVPSNLSNLKSKVDKLDVDKLVAVPVDLSKLSDLVKSVVIKKDKYNAKVKDIEDKILDITNLATNTTLNAKINDVKIEIPSITNLATTIALNAKINEVKNKVTNATNLATTTTLTTIEYEIPYHSKYITTPEFNKLAAENFAAGLAQANLARKNYIANFVKKTDFDDKLKNFDKKLLQIKQNILVENELKKLQRFDSSLFIGQSYFNSNRAQLYLILQPLYYTLKRLDDTERVVLWESKGL